MPASSLLFWVFAAMVVSGGLMAVLLPRIVHAVFSLMLCFVGVAAVYVLAGADFKPDHPVFKEKDKCVA